MSLDHTANITRWLDIAKPGKSIVYHIGNLALDRQVCGFPRQPIDNIAKAMYRAAMDGIVHLVQLREAPGVCTYVAVMRPKGE